MPYAIYNDNIMFGFAFLIYQPINEEDKDDEENIYYLARIMIDQKYQGEGFGKESLNKLIDELKTFPNGPAEAIILSSNPYNQPAYNLFLSFGFKEMGIVDDDGDNLLRLDLN